jgi:hypothetical protein
MFLLHVSIPTTCFDIYKVIIREVYRIPITYLDNYKVIIILEAYTDTYMISRCCQICAYVELNYNIVSYN